ncbi:serine protease [Amycolatopsis samaneae]
MTELEARTPATSAKPPRPLVLLLALAGALALVTGTASAANDIVGGKDADQPYPFTVSLHTAGGKLFCAGALIAPTWLVTAAHCVDGKKPEVVTARVGSNDSGQGGEPAQPAEFVVNPAFNPDKPEVPGGDIALVRLVNPVKTAPIPLGTVTAPGTATRLLGWGQTCPTLDCGKPPAVLQQLDTHVVDAKGCVAPFDAKTELCTENPGGKAGSCYGDSGGPEIAKDGERWLLLGLTSRPGNGDATCATGPSIYTSAVAYAPWIAEKTTPKPPPPGKPASPSGAGA